MFAFQVTFLCLLAFSLFICCFLPERVPNSVPEKSYLITTSPWQTQSLTAIISVTEDLTLNNSLLPLLCAPSSVIFEIFILCPESIALPVRRWLHNIFLSSPCPDDLPDISLRPWSPSAALHTVNDISTEWAFVLDDSGFITPLDLPISPKALIAWTPALELVPPYLIHKSLFDSDPDSLQHVLQGPTDLEGRIYLFRSHNCLHTNSTVTNNPLPPKDTTFPSKAPEPTLTFSIILPSVSDLQQWSHLLCSLQSKGSELRILLYDGSFSQQKLSTHRCTLLYDTLKHRFTPSSIVNDIDGILDWLVSSPIFPDVIFTSQDVPAYIFSEDVLATTIPRSVPVIRLPTQDVPVSDWMSSLTLEEWKNWHTPQLELSIITKDRPHSLQRLLTSLTSALYFGDTLTLRINTESSSDPLTLSLIQEFSDSWSHGPIFIHHRIIPGGLLPAVVESWYPKDNNTYGLLLEDDVELSPLFYAWLKMGLLRYRYGSPENRSRYLFGISLYQQKNLELLPAGRKPFDARKMFGEMGFGERRRMTPYLSQIPCSWGAVYFPEHWREFHAYLAVRFSNPNHRLQDDIVPNVRSNHWIKSWKKYFIELVYLRGYTMLYPNFDGFISLSTNHLEVGAHVKVRSPEKRDAFLLPLMALPTGVDEDSPLKVGLPDGTLPSLDDLPVLNLTGSIVSAGTLIETGLNRRNVLFNCTDSESILYDVGSLTCTRT